MTAQKYANFPERELKVVIGPHISVSSTRILGKMSIGIYEMSVNQQEKLQSSSESGRHAMNALAKELQMSVTSAENRDYLCALTGANSAHRFQIWITPPFESGQTSHLVWCKYSDLTAERKVGVSFKLSTSFNVDEILTLLKQAQKNAVDLPADEPYTLKGNPPPRFTKKAVPAADAPAAEAPAVPAADATPPAQ